MYSSSDGRAFVRIGLAGYSGDRTTLHFDALLNRWVFSLRDVHRPLGRARRFFVQESFVPPAKRYGWRFGGRKAPEDVLVEPDVWTELDELGYAANESLYNFDAVRPPVRDTLLVLDLPVGTWRIARLCRGGRSGLSRSPRPVIGMVINFDGQQR